MPTQEAPSAVADTVPQEQTDVAVGENLDFQRKWWRFETIIWCFFAVILLCDVLGLFGRGWLAKAKRTDSANTLTLDYERIERASTPSIMTLHFHPAASSNGRVQLFVSDSIVRRLGAERISPQPAVSAITSGGYIYLFPASNAETTAEITLSPTFPGRHHFRLQVEGGGPVEADVVVLP